MDDRGIFDHLFFPAVILGGQLQVVSVQISAPVVAGRDRVMDLEQCLLKWMILPLTSSVLLTIQSEPLSKKRAVHVVIDHPLRTHFELRNHNAISAVDALKCVTIALFGGGFYGGGPARFTGGFHGDNI